MFTFYYLYLGYVNYVNYSVYHGEFKTGGGMLKLGSVYPQDGGPRLIIRGGGGGTLDGGYVRFATPVINYGII